MVSVCCVRFSLVPSYKQSLTHMDAVFRRQSVDGARKLSFNLPSFFRRSYMPRFTCSTDQIVGIRCTRCVQVRAYAALLTVCQRVCECLVFFFFSFHYYYYCHGRLAIARGAFPHTISIDAMIANVNSESHTVWRWTKWWR